MREPLVQRGRSLPITALGRKGEWSVVSADGRITRNPAPRNAFLSAGLVGFFFSPSLKKSKLEKQTARLLLLWPELTAQAALNRNGCFELPDQRPEVPADRTLIPSAWCLDSDGSPLPAIRGRAIALAIRCRLSASSRALIGAACGFHRVIAQITNPPLSRASDQPGAVKFGRGRAEPWRPVIEATLPSERPLPVLRV
jgi:hypothetical protein